MKKNNFRKILATTLCYSLFITSLPLLPSTAIATTEGSGNSNVDAHLPVAGNNNPSASVTDTNGPVALCTETYSSAEILAMQASNRNTAQAKINAAYTAFGEAVIALKLQRYLEGDGWPEAISTVAAPSMSELEAIIANIRGAGITLIGTMQTASRESSQAVEATATTNTANEAVVGQNQTTQANYDSKVAALQADIDAAQAKHSTCQSEYTAMGCNGSNLNLGNGGISCEEKQNECQVKQQAINSANAAYNDFKNPQNGIAVNMQQAQVTNYSTMSGSMANNQSTTADSAAATQSMVSQEIVLEGTVENYKRVHNAAAEVAIQKATLARQKAIDAINEFGSPNAAYDKTEAMSLISLVGSDVSRAPEDLAFIEQISLTSAGAFEVQCTDVTNSDVRCISYHLYVAASAVYLASMIVETGEYNKNMAAIMCLERATGYNDQVWNLERAALLAREVSRIADMRSSSNAVLLDMYNIVDKMAQIELDGKMARIEAAQRRLAADAESIQNNEEAEGTFNMLKMIMMAAGIALIALGLFHTQMGEALIAKGMACSPSICSAMVAAGKALVLLGGVESENGTYWKAVIAGVILAGVAMFFGNEKDKAKENQKRSQEELNRAMAHTHMNCIKEFSARAPTPLPLPNEPLNSSGGFPPNGSTPLPIGSPPSSASNWTLGSSFLYALNLLFDLLIPKAFSSENIISQIASLDDLQGAIGILDSTEANRFFTSHEDIVADRAVQNFPIPETRVNFTGGVLLPGANGALLSITGESGEISTSDAHLDDYVHILNTAYTEFEEAPTNQQGVIPSDAARGDNQTRSADNAVVGGGMQAGFNVKVPEGSISTGKNSTNTTNKNTTLVSNTQGGSLGSKGELEGKDSATRKLTTKERKKSILDKSKKKNDSANSSPMLAEIRSKALQTYRSGGPKLADGSAKSNLLASIRGIKLDSTSLAKPSPAKKSSREDLGQEQNSATSLVSFRPGTLPEMIENNEKQEAILPISTADNSAAERAYLDKMRSRDKSRYKEEKDDIVRDRDTNLFKIISLRYKKTAIPRFFDKVN